MTPRMLALILAALSLLAFAGWAVFVRVTGRGGPGTRLGAAARMVGAVWLCFALMTAAMAAATFAGLPDSVLRGLKVAGLVGTVSVGVWFCRERVAASASQKPFPWLATLGATAAAGAVGFGGAAYEAHRETAQIRAALEAKNAALPQRLDEFTTLERIDYAPRTREILYLNRLEGLDADQIAALAADLRTSLRDRVCAAEEMKPLLAAKFRLVYLYAHDDKWVAEVGVAGADCP